MDEGLIMADVNGNKCADAVRFGNDGVYVGSSNCVNGFNPINKWTTDFDYNVQGRRVEMHPRTLADVNGDGKADTIGFDYYGVWVGLPNGQLSTTYWLPWYNNVDLDTQLRFGVPYEPKTIFL